MKQVFYKILDILFPKNCVFCKKQGSFLCEDCFSLIEINTFPCRNNIFVAANQNQIINKIIDSYNSGIKELSYPLSIIILTHFLLLKKDCFSNFVIFPTPQSQKDIKRTGFNKTKEVAKIISEKLKIKIIEDIDQIIDKNIMILDIVYSEKTEKIFKQIEKISENQIVEVVIIKH
jgi:predicted amidophosphoribosyltransferase